MDEDSSLSLYHPASAPRNIGGMTPGTSKNLLRVADSACDARCTARTAALLGQIGGRSRRFFEVPGCMV